ncbi:hypothetical protein HJC99_05235 [Candidatus Saccharibacteria bacterium]|nr:hypothetical protein [Candidatus Saccharibacteria bacterium]
MLRRIATIFGYLALACLIVLLTVGLVAYGQDYSYSISQHRIIRSGNVIIQTVPSGVAVSIDGHPNKKRTSYRLATGKSYLFAVSKTGFHTWQKALTTLAGKITLVQYIVLVPNELIPQALATAPTVISQAASHDRRHVAYITGGSTPGVFVDNYDNQPVKIYSPVAATAATGAETLQSVTWSDDASHVLIMSSFNGATVARVMAADGSGAENLTDKYHYDFSTLKFSAGNWRQLYWIAPDGLRRLDLDTQTVSAVLASGVKQIEILDSSVMYVQETTLGQSLWLLDGKNGKPQQLIAALPASDHYGLAYTNYRGTDALAVVPSATQAGTLYTNIFGDTPQAQTVAHGVTDVSFSPDGHLVAFSGLANITTYDLEASSIFDTSTLYTFAVNNLSTPPAWFDNFHLLSNQNGRLIWTDFDGANGVDLGLTQATLSAGSSSDVKNVYVWQPTASAVQLTTLTIKP